MNRRSRAPETRGIPGFPTSCLRARTNSIAGEVHRRTDLVGTLKSAQRESNPHFRHGKATGCRYIMGALWCAELSKIQEHRERLELSSPHYGCGILAAGRPVPSITSVGPDGLEPSPGGLRVRCAAANTLIPCSPFVTRREWARRESNPQSDPYKRPALTVELRAATGEWGRKDLNLHQPD